MRKYSNPAALALLALAAAMLTGCGDQGVEYAQPRSFTGAAFELESELAPETNVHVVISLKLSDSAGLERFVSELHTPGSPNFRRHLPPAEVTRRFGPTQGQVNRVTSFLEAKGFTNITVASNRLLIEADAPAGVVTTAFKTRLAQFRLEGGTLAYANTAPAVLPANLEGDVLEVLGLDTVTRVRSLVVQAQPEGELRSAVTPQVTAVAVGHNPTQFPAIYNVGNTPSASNVTVGIVAWGSMDQTLIDLQAFTQQNNLPAVTTSVIYPGGKGTASAQAEWSMDSQAIVGMSGGVQRLDFYVAKTATTADVTSAINAAASANAARVINMSFGSCETYASRLTNDNIFQTAIAQGQTFVASSGDHGSNGNGDYQPDGGLNPSGCTGTYVLYPASSPYVVTVGGTTVQTNSMGGYDSETAWSGSGGGISRYEGIAHWQPVASPLSNSSYRGLPDVAFDADPVSGALVNVSGQVGQYGGTSLAAPLFTATWARMLSQCGSLGFAAPTLYAYRNLHASMLYDVTSGSNGAYSSASGWDFVTGWGTPNINNMWSAVCPAAAAYYATVQKIYVGYLGRPVDPSGLANMSLVLQNANAPTDLANLQAAYSTNPTVRSTIDGIQGSAESRSVYPTSDKSAYVTALFNALFNRPPTSTELSTYVTALNNGTLPMGDIALKIMSDKWAQRNSALTEVVIMQNKVGIAGNFTATLTPSTAPSYSGDVAATSARHMLRNAGYAPSGTVDVILYWNQPAYISAFQPTVQSTIANIVAGIPQ